MVDTFPRPDWLFQLVLRRDAYEGIRAELDAQLQELDASRERAALSTGSRPGQEAGAQGADRRVAVASANRSREPAGGRAGQHAHEPGGHHQKPRAVAKEPPAGNDHCVDGKRRLHGRNAGTDVEGSLRGPHWAGG